MQAPVSSAPSFPTTQPQHTFASAASLLLLGPRPDAPWLWPSACSGAAGPHPLRAHLSWCMTSQVLGATRSMHTFIEALELPDTAASPANRPCPAAVSSTLPFSCPSMASWKWKGPSGSTAGARPELRPCLTGCGLSYLGRGTFEKALPAEEEEAESPEARSRRQAGLPAPLPPGGSDSGLDRVPGSGASGSRISLMDRLRHTKRRFQNHELEHFLLNRQ